jgi:hypothetical protein
MSDFKPLGGRASLHWDGLTTKPKDSEIPKPTPKAKKRL